MQKIIIIFCLFILAGCHSTLKKDLPQLYGGNIKEAFDALGYPNGSYMKGSEDVYVWQVASTVYLPTTKNTNVYGTIGTTNFYGTLTTQENMPYITGCIIRIISRAGIIIKYTYEGSILGCSSYASRLRKYVKNKLKQKELEEEFGETKQELENSINYWENLSKDNKTLESDIKFDAEVLEAIQQKNSWDNE